MLKLVNVSKYYTTNGVVALGLRKVNLELHVNEFVAVVGESGSGKTTLLNVISGIDSYEEGEMYLNGEETSYYSTSDLENYRKRYIAFVFQNYNLIDSFSVKQNVEMPMLLAGVSAKEASRRAKDIIRRVGLEKHMHHKATKLSGGQKQRVVIARALAKDCPIIAADEPTGNLDSESAKQIIELLQEIAKDKLVIIVTHDFQQVKDYATRKIRIYDGEVVEDTVVRKTTLNDLPVIPEGEKNISLLEHVKMAAKTLFSVPKKTILLVMVFFIFSFLIGMVYGAYNAAITNTGGYDDWSIKYFNNTSASRLVIRKADRSAFSSEDLAQIRSNNLVKTIIPDDYLLDISAWYRSLETFESNDNYNYYLSNVFYLPDTLVKNADESFNNALLLHGTWPVEDNDVVIALPQMMLENDEYLSYIVNQTYQITNVRSVNSTPPSTYKIVGVVSSLSIGMQNSASYLLISGNEYNRLADFFYPFFTKNMELTTERTDIGNFKYWLNEQIRYNNLRIVASPSFADNQIGIWREYSPNFCDVEPSSCTATTTLIIEDAYVTQEFPDLEILFGMLPSTLRVSQHLYDQIFYDDVYQVSVISTSDVIINVESLQNTLSRIKEGGVEKYRVIYPNQFEVVDDWEAAIRFFEVIGMLAVLVISILGSTILSYIIFRLIINTKLRDYAIFRTVGANQMMIRLMIYFENAMIVSMSYLLFIALSVVIKNLDSISPYSLLYGLKGFTFWNYLFFFGIVLLISILISGRYCRKVFRDSVQTSLKAE
jgi:ABC-type lipoprotein export system ATPase subunit/ABC-type antimicrobial peptide transport system permease subunit